MDSINISGETEHADKYYPPHTIIDERVFVDAKQDLLSLELPILGNELCDQLVSVRRSLNSGEDLATRLYAEHKSHTAVIIAVLAERMDIISPRSSSEGTWIEVSIEYVESFFK